MKAFKTDRQLFEAIFQHATMGILVTGSQGEIIKANHFAIKEFGYEEGELIGKKVENLIPERFHHQHMRDRGDYYDHATTRAMGAGRDLYGLRKNGSEFPVEVSLSPFRTEEGLFVIVFIIDITIRKEKETAEKEYQGQIAEILKSLRKEKELNDMKSRFVSMASHEFKTPLSTILSSASLLSKYTSTEEQLKREKHIERIKSAVRNLNGILNEFLSVGRIENGKIQAHYTEFDLTAFINSICVEIRDLKKKRQEIHYVHSGEKTILLDKELLRNILINLLANAIKFSDEDGNIQITSYNKPEALIIKVKDNGLGVAPDDQEHLFELFFRGNNVLNIPGTGLGLHIVSRYTELMKGAITFNSILNKGTEFILNFKK